METFFYKMRYDLLARDCCFMKTSPKVEIDDVLLSLEYLLFVNLSQNICKDQTNSFASKDFVSLCFTLKPAKESTYFIFENKVLMSRHSCLTAHLDIFGFILFCVYF